MKTTNQNNAKDTCLCTNVKTKKFVTKYNNGTKNKIGRTVKTS
jgi:hypothetical protein